MCILFFVSRQIAELVAVVEVQTVQTADLSDFMLTGLQPVLSRHPDFLAGAQ